MTQDRDLEHLLDRWLADGPLVVADRVIDDAAARLAHHRQRPAWRLRPWRFPTMSSPLRLLALAGALLVALVAGGLILTVGGGGTAQRTPAPSASAAPSPSPAPSVAQWWDHDCGSCAGDLAAGTHTSRSLQPALTFTVPAGWINDYDQAKGFELLQDNPGNRSCFASQTATCEALSINRDVRLAASDCSNGAAPGAKLDAASVVAGLSARPGLVVSKAVRTSVGGLQGLQIDVQLAADWKTACPGGGDPAVATVTDGGALWKSGPGARSRFILLDLPQGNALIQVNVDSSDAFDGFVSQVMPIIDSFQFASGS